MTGIWTTVCISAIACLAYLIGRQQRDEEYRELRDDLTPPPFKPAKKERVKVCGCGRRLSNDH